MAEAQVLAEINLQVEAAEAGGSSAEAMRTAATTAALKGDAAAEEFRPRAAAGAAAVAEAAQEVKDEVAGKADFSAMVKRANRAPVSRAAKDAAASKLQARQRGIMARSKIAALRVPRRSEHEAEVDQGHPDGSVVVPSVRTAKDVSYQRLQQPLPPAKREATAPEQSGDQLRRGPPPRPNERGERGEPDPWRRAGPVAPQERERAVIKLQALERGILARAQVQRLRDARATKDAPKAAVDAANDGVRRADESAMRFTAMRVVWASRLQGLSPGMAPKSGRSPRRFDCRGTARTAAAQPVPPCAPSGTVAKVVCSPVALSPVSVVAGQTSYPPAWAPPIRALREAPLTSSGSLLLPCQRMDLGDLLLKEIWKLLLYSLQASLCRADLPLDVPNASFHCNGRVSSYGDRLRLSGAEAFRDDLRSLRDALGASNPLQVPAATWYSGAALPSKAAWLAEGLQKLWASPSTSASASRPKAPSQPLEPRLAGLDTLTTARFQQGIASARSSHDVHGDGVDARSPRSPQPAQNEVALSAAGLAWHLRIMEAAQSMSQPPSPSGSVRSIRSVPRAEPSAKELREMLENPIAEGHAELVDFARSIARECTGASSSAHSSISASRLSSSSRPREVSRLGVGEVLRGASGPSVEVLQEQIQLRQQELAFKELQAQEDEALHAREVSLLASSLHRLGMRYGRLLGQCQALEALVPERVRRMNEGSSSNARSNARP
eukprot:g31881.t1